MKTLIKVVLFAVVTSFSALGFADGHSTMRVVAVQTSDAGAYVVELRKGKQMMNKIAPKMVMRAWRATFAGEGAGTVIVSLEHPGSLSTFASAWEKTLADKKMAEWLSGLSGLRQLVSDSLYEEMPI
ncbi:MAG: hypothetical protein V7709_00315 [Halioglobus sp.]